MVAVGMARVVRVAEAMEEGAMVEGVRVEEARVAAERLRHDGVAPEHLHHRGVVGQLLEHHRQVHVVAAAGPVAVAAHAGRLPVRPSCHGATTSAHLTAGTAVRAPSVSTVGRGGCPPVAGVGSAAARCRLVPGTCRLRLRSSMAVARAQRFAVA